MSAYDNSVYRIRARLSGVIHTRFVDTRHEAELAQDLFKDQGATAVETDELYYMVYCVPSLSFGDIEEEG